MLSEACKVSLLLFVSKVEDRCIIFFVLIANSLSSKWLYCRHALRSTKSFEYLREIVAALSNLIILN